MNRLPARYQLPLVAGVSLVVVLLVVGAVLLAGGVGPAPTPPLTPSAAASSSADSSTPEEAARAFFVAYGQASRTDDASLVLPFVTSDRSSAYLSAKGFLDGQRELGKGAVITEQRFDNLNVEADDGTARVSFDYVEGGYLIDLDTGQPLESPNVLPPSKVTVHVQRVDGRWLVDSYESAL